MQTHHHHHHDHHSYSFVVVVLCLILMMMMTSPHHHVQALSSAVNNKPSPSTASTMRASSNVQKQQEKQQEQKHPSRRSFFVAASTTSATVTAAIFLPQAGQKDHAHAATGGGDGDLKFETAPSGLQWADAKLGTGTALKAGNQATVEYTLSTTGARYGAKIFSTKDRDMPYRWTLGDGSTIAGMEQAILGVEGSIPPMLPGGVRRVIIPQSLAYDKLGASVGQAKELCVQDGTPGPIPPPNQAFEEYQRFKNIYCNPLRQYQPDVVMDIKLYGARSVR